MLFDDECAVQSPVVVKTRHVRTDTGSSARCVLNEWGTISIQNRPEVGVRSILLLTIE